MNNWQRFNFTIKCYRSYTSSKILIKLKTQWKVNRIPVINWTKLSYDIEVLSFPFPSFFKTFLWAFTFLIVNLRQNGYFSIFFLTLRKIWVQLTKIDPFAHSLNSPVVFFIQWPAAKRDVSPRSCPLLPGENECTIREGKVDIGNLVHCILNWSCGKQSDVVHF